MTHRSRVRICAAALLAALAGAVSVAPPAHADVVEYVNLGDSFSAGSGVLPLVSDAPLACLRSERNFARVVAEQQGYELIDVSCGGASTEDFRSRQHPDTPPQLDALSPSTDLVTMMIGGNDGGVFAGAISECVRAAIGAPGTSSPCADTFGSSFVDTIERQTYPAIVQALSDVRDSAPDAHIVIVGYPWLLPAQGTCSPNMPVADGDVPYLRTLQTTLNTAVSRAASETGATFVDMSVVSEGHDGCQPSGTRWIEPLVFSEQFVPVHPNALGEAAIAVEVTKVLAPS
ncbi:MAG: SGNH/GDSL hydrolase family protein [Rhodococcus sp. (in: high G+C Gram-positive bacteria)]|jgi:lysophospholipase L1-like esterase